MTVSPVLIDEELLNEVRRRVGEAAVIVYVTGAVRRQLRHDRLEDHLAEADARSGPVPRELLDEARRLWRDDGSRDDRQV